MSDQQLTKAAIDARYQSSYGRLAGFLPKDREAADDWQRNLMREVKEERSKGKHIDSKAVQELRKLIETDGIVRMYVTEMINQTNKDYRFVSNSDKDVHVQNVEQLLTALDMITRKAPRYNPDPTKRVFFPMSNLFRYMMMTRAGEAVFRNPAFNEALRKILKEWCHFLDSDKSLYVLNTDEDGWLSKSSYSFNKLAEFVFDRKLPHWGWTSFNDFFHRQIKPGSRPIDRPDDPKVIVSANDGTVYNIARNVKRTDNFWLKAQPYSLVNMMDNSDYVDRFVGGDVFQSFLSGADYHRWRSPVAGTVRHAQLVDGLMWSDAESAGFDDTAATYSQGYDACVNTRGLVFIESEDPVVGMICVIPIGITEISSVTIGVKAGDKLKKGDELGYFSYGGTSMCLVFQPGTIDHFTVENRQPDCNPDEGPPVKVNAQVAVAK